MWCSIWFLKPPVFKWMVACFWYFLIISLSRKHSLYLLHSQNKYFCTVYVEWVLEGFRVQEFLGPHRAGVFPAPRDVPPRDICTPTFSAAWFTAVMTWKHPTCPLTDEQIKKIWSMSIYTVQRYSTIKRGESYHLTLRGWTWGRCAQWGTSDRERQIPYVLICMCIWKHRNSWEQCRMVVVGGAGWEKWGGRGQGEASSSLWVSSLTSPAAPLQRSLQRGSVSRRSSDGVADTDVS